MIFLVDFWGNGFVIFEVGELIVTQMKAVNLLTFQEDSPNF
jgi:hypothetical protein